MKKVIFTIGLSVGVSCFYAQEHYFYVGGQKRILEVSDSKMFVKSDSVDATRIRNELYRVDAARFKRTYEVSDNLTMVEMQNTTRKGMADLQKQWQNRQDVSYTSPVFVDKNGEEIGGLTDKVLVRLKALDDYPLNNSKV